MRPQLRARADAQLGLFTRHDAVSAGYTERELRTHTAVHGPWVIVRRGVYQERVEWEAERGPDHRMRLIDRAVHLTMRAPHVLSHDSAARTLGIPLLRNDHDLAHVTRTGLQGTRTEHGVKHHLTRRPLPEAVATGPLPTTTPARTALDLAREHGLTSGVIACDHVLNAGTPRRSFEHELVSMWCWPHVTRARAAFELADGWAESIGETLTRLLVLELDLGEVESQFPVRIPSGVAWADLRVGCHLVEFDGRVKVVPVERGGVATRNADQVVWDERRRQHDMCAEGFGMSRVRWEDLFGTARERTKRRLAEEYAVTARRFGPLLPPHLRQFADRLKAGRARRTV